MKTLPVLTLSFIALFASAATAMDYVTLIRCNKSAKKNPLFLNTYRPDELPGNFLGVLCYNTTNAKKAAGMKPVRHAFPADYDGDGIDEVVLIRKLKKKGQLDLRVYQMPNQVHGVLGTKYAWSAKNDVGPAEGDGRVICCGAGDIDGDSIDELLLIRQSDTGIQSLEIRNLPPGKGKPMGPPTRSDFSFGQAGSDKVISIFGADVDADGKEEIVTLRRGAGGSDSLQVFEAPAGPGGETGAAISSYLNVTASGDYRNVSIAGFLPDDNENEQVLFWQRTPEGMELLNVHDLPTSVSAAFGAPVLTDATPGTPTKKAGIFAAFGSCHRTTAPNEMNTLIGDWDLTLTVTVPGADPPEIQVGPFDVKGAVDYMTLTLSVKNDPDPAVVVSGEVIELAIPSATIVFPSTVHNLNLPGDAGTATFRFGHTTLTNLGGLPEITGPFVGIAGTYTDPAGTNTGPITAWKLKRK